MPEVVLALIGGTVLNAAVLGTILAFHRSAVNAHKLRADGWERAYMMERKISVENDRQVTTVVRAVDRATQEVS